MWEKKGDSGTLWVGIRIWTGFKLGYMTGGNRVLGFKGTLKDIHWKDVGIFKSYLKYHYPKTLGERDVSRILLD